MNTNLKISSLLILASSLVTQAALADSPIYCNNGRLTTYAFCKIKVGMDHNQQLFDVYMGFCNESGMNLYAANGTDNQLTPVGFTTVPALLTENFSSAAPANRNDYAYLVKNVEGNRNLTWHVKPTVGPIALSNTPPNRVDELPDCKLSPLPVELTRFVGATSTLDASKVELTWNTASEKNSDRFDIQKSEDGVTFSQIGSTKGAGNSVTAQAYNFLTPKMASGMHYFRLKQVDLDQTVTFSPVVAVSTRSSADIQGQTVYPNPATRGDVVTVTNSNDSIEIAVIDMSGKTVMTVPAGTLTIDSSSLNPGMYIVRAGGKFSRLEIR